MWKPLSIFRKFGMVVLWPNILLAINKKKNKLDFIETAYLKYSMTLIDSSLISQ